MRKPWIAHLTAALGRFFKRLGPQFAGSVTYFSILSMIPVLMFAVALLGLTVDVFRPDLLTEMQAFLQSQLGATAQVTDDADQKTQDLADEIGKFVTSTFKGWRGILLFAFVAGAYSGSNWVQNLKHAVRAMWKDSFAEAAKKGSFFKELTSNIIIFFGLLMSIAIAVGVTAAGQAFPEEIISWLGVENVPGINILLQLVRLAISLLTSWLLFAFLFVVLPGERTRPATFLKGTIAGAVLVTALQLVASVLVTNLGSIRSVVVFGPIIILMIVFNVLAVIILLVAAWVGTADTWEIDRAKKQAREAAGVEAEDEMGLDDEDAQPSKEMVVRAPSAVPTSHRVERWAAERDPEGLLAVNYDPATVNVEDPDATVRQDVAARSVRVGMGLGYGVGAATGAGLGAMIAALFARISRR